MQKKKLSYEQEVDSLLDKNFSDWLIKNLKLEDDLLSNNNKNLFQPPKNKNDNDLVTQLTSWLTKVEGLLQNYRKEIKEKQTLIDQQQKELEKYKKQKETKYLVDEN